MPDGCSDSVVPEETSNADSTVIHEIASITGLEWREATQLFRRHNSNLEAAINAHFQAIDSEFRPSGTTHNYVESRKDRNRSPPSNQSENLTPRDGVTARHSSSRSSSSGMRRRSIPHSTSEPTSLIGRLRNQIRALFKHIRSVTSWISLFCLRLFTIDSGVRGFSSESDFATALSQSLLSDADDTDRAFRRTSHTNIIRSPALINSNLSFAGTNIEEAMAVASRELKPLVVVIADGSALTATQHKNIRTLLRQVFIEGDLGMRVAREACVFGFSPSQSFGLRLLTNVFTHDSTSQGLVHLSVILPFIFDASLLPSMRQTIERDRRNGRSPGLSYMSGTSSVFGQSPARKLPIEQQQVLFQAILDVWSTIQSDIDLDLEMFRLNLLRSGVVRFFCVDFHQPSPLNSDPNEKFIEKFNQALDFGSTFCELLRQQCENTTNQQARDREIIISQEREYQESLRLDQLKEQQKRDSELDARKEAERHELEEKAKRDEQLAEQERRQKIVKEMKNASIRSEELEFLKENYSNIVVRIPSVSIRANFKVSKKLVFENFSRVVAVADYLFSNPHEHPYAMIVSRSDDPIGVSCQPEIPIDDDDIFTKTPDYISPIPSNFELVPSFRSSVGKLDTTLSIEELHLTPSAVLHLVAVDT